MKSKGINLTLVVVESYCSFAGSKKYKNFEMVIFFFFFLRKNQQDVFNILGALFSAAVFFGIINCSLVIPLVTTERTVLYRERFAGMYSPWAYSFAQVLIYFAQIHYQVSITLSLFLQVTEIL